MKLPILALAMIAMIPVQAETLKSAPTTLDPKKAYVLIEYRLTPNSMSNFPGSKKYLPLFQGLALGRYDTARQDIRGRGAATGNPVATGQVAIERFQNRSIAKREDSRLVLLAVEPDTWVVQGWGNTSFSLGSYSFSLEAGTVTDLGVVTAADDWAEGERPKLDAGRLMKLMVAGPFMKPRVVPSRAMFRSRQSSDMPIPAGLLATLRPVVFKPGARFGNYLGGLVNRIEGVNAKPAPTP